MANTLFSVEQSREISKYEIQEFLLANVNVGVNLNAISLAECAADHFGLWEFSESGNGDYFPPAQIVEWATDEIDTWK